MNQEQLDGLEATGKKYQVALGAGLLLEVTATGKKAYYHRYREGGKEKRARIAGFDTPLSTVRSLHQERKSGEPLSREEEPETVGQLAALTTKGGFCTKHITPTFGSVKIADLKPVRVKQFIDQHAESNRQRAATIYGAFVEIYNAAILHGIITHSPMAVIARPKTTVKPRDVILSLEELRSLLHSEGASLHVRHALALIIYTMSRKMEVLEARWEEIDTDKGVWVIPADRMKGGRAHTIPLTAPMRALLIEIAGGDLPATGYLFPSPTKQGAALSQSTVNIALAKLKPGIHPHDLRRSGATHLASHGYPAEVIEAALAHKTQGIRKHYIHTDFFEQRAAMLAEYHQALTA